MKRPAGSCDPFQRCRRPLAQLAVSHWPCSFAGSAAGERGLSGGVAGGVGASTASSSRGCAWVTPPVPSMPPCAVYLGEESLSSSGSRHPRSSCDAAVLGCASAALPPGAGALIRSVPCCGGPLTNHPPVSAVPSGSRGEAACGRPPSWLLVCTDCARLPTAATWPTGAGRVGPTSGRAGWAGSGAAWPRIPAPVASSLRRDGARSWRTSA